MNVNVENMRAWIEALESGKYEQCTSVLHIKATASAPERFCCLGVACVVAMAAGADVVSAGINSYGEYLYHTVEDPNLVGDATAPVGSVLPAGVVRWLGLDERSGFAGDVLLDSGNNTSATQANDQLGWDFPQIAAALRDRYGITALHPVERE
jgi:hypothetical protein